MTDAVVSPKIHSIAGYEEFIIRPENTERRFELIHGEIVEKMPAEEHATLAAWAAYLLLSHVHPRKLGRVAVEPRHQVPGDNYNARLPDVAFTSAERALPLVKKGGVPQMPDLAIEIKSPGDRPHEMREKALYTLQNGSRRVWLLYAESTSVEVCSLNESGVLQIQSLAADDTLDGGDVLPGFQITVRELFAVE